MSSKVSVYSSRSGSIGYCWRVPGPTGKPGKQHSFRIHKGTNTIDADKFAEFANSEYGKPYVTPGKFNTPPTVYVIPEGTEPESEPQEASNEGDAPKDDAPAKTSDSDEPPKVSPLVEHNAATAIEMIKGAEDKELLKRVYETDERKTVTAAAAKRAAELAG